MTMLDSMRRHIGWLKWSLGLVILAFAFLYIPDLSNSTPQLTGALTDVVATVGEREITVGEFRTVYLRQLRNYQAQSGGEITAEILRSMGLDRQILQQMIDEYAALQEAERLGVTVTDKEIRDRIVSFPAFQQNGQFVGEQAYIQSLRLQSPPMTPAQFEEDIRRSLMLERLQAAVTDWITVTDEDLRREHVRRSETISVSAISFRADDFRESGARQRKLNGPPDSVEQHHSELGFQLLDVGRHRGLPDAQLLRRLRHAHQGRADGAGRSLRGRGHDPHSPAGAEDDLHRGEFRGDAARAPPGGRSREAGTRPEDPRRRG